MKKTLRDYFDAQVNAVITQLPAEARHVIETEVPIQVEDFPSDDVMEEMGIDYPDELCGLYTGVALTERSIEDVAPLPDQVILYRLGILFAVLDEDESLPDEFFDDLDDDLGNLSIDKIDKNALQEQIRITILHELGHLHGLDEDALDNLGYA